MSGWTSRRCPRAQAAPDRVAYAWLLLPLLLVAGGCQSVQTTRGGVVGVDRQQRMSSLVPASDVEATARQQYAQIVADARGKGLLNRDPEATERVRPIARRLIPNTSAFRDDAPGWAWEVNVLGSDDVNAWCMPGGKIAVYTGLIDKLHPSDDELAAVMGHEIGHALREHARERMAVAVPAGVVVSIVGAIYGQGAQDVSSLFLQAMFVLPNSRVDEQEADRIGVELAARSGYDPRAGVSLWNKMIGLGGSQPPQWLSTHPSHESRVRDLQEYSQRVLPLYEQAQRR